MFNNVNEAKIHYLLDSKLNRIERMGKTKREFHKWNGHTIWFVNVETGTEHPWNIESRSNLYIKRQNTKMRNDQVRAL